MRLAVEEVFRNTTHFLDTRVALQGMFFVDVNTWLAAGFDECIGGQHLLIRDGDAIVTHLFRTMPPGGGGRFMYYGQMRITGRITKGANSLELTEISGCHVIRSDGKFEADVPLPDDGPGKPF